MRPPGAQIPPDEAVRVKETFFVTIALKVLLVTLVVFRRETMKLEVTLLNNLKLFIKG